MDRVPPQGLKPRVFCDLNGTAKAVPFHKAIYEIAFQFSVLSAFFASRCPGAGLARGTDECVRPYTGSDPKH